MKKKKHKYSNKRYKERQTKSKASKYICHYPDIPKNSIYMVFARVSSSEQEIKGYLKSQVKRLTAFIKKEKLNVAFNEIFCIQRGAFWTKQQRRNTPKQLNSDKFQKPHYPDLFVLSLLFKLHYRADKDRLHLLFESTDRIIRSDNWDFNNQDSPITQAEFDELVRITHGIPLVTIINPDAAYKEVERYRKKHKYIEPKKPKTKVGVRLEREEKYYVKFLFLKTTRPTITRRQIFNHFNGKLEDSCIRFWNTEYNKGHIKSGYKNKIK